MSEKYTDRYAGKYAEIIDLPHYQSSRRPHMSNYDRAAQFSPFAALNGYEAAVAETGWLTDERLELSEEEMQVIDRKLQYIAAHIAEQPEVSITYFQPDEHKSGGAYISVTGLVYRIDTIKSKVIFVNGEEIPIWDILQIEGKLLDKLQKYAYGE